MASHATRDHDEIRRWAEQHQACPSVVSRTGGMLRFEFRDNSGELEEVDWESFFQVFEEKGLELIYDDKPGSRFHKFAYPETVAAGAHKKSGSAASGRGGAKGKASAENPKRGSRARLQPVAAGGARAEAKPARKSGARGKSVAKTNSRAASTRGRKAA